MYNVHVIGYTLKLVLPHSDYYYFFSTAAGVYNSVTCTDHRQNSSKSVGINNPSGKRRKTSPLNSSNAHLGPKPSATKVKVGKSQEVHEVKRQPPWKQQQQHTCSPSADNWSGNYHQPHSLQESGGNGSDKEQLPRGRQPKTRVSRNSDEEDLSEKLFSQLYQSSQPDELDKVYFDMKDVLIEEEVDEHRQFGRSIIVDREEPMEVKDSTTTQEDPMATESSSQSMSQEQSQLSLTSFSSSSSVFSRRFLTLSSHPHAIPTVHRPRLILCGSEGMGQTSLLSPALLHALEEFPVKTLDLTTVFATSTKTPEEACTQVRTCL